jgi:hypothetical protein
MTLQRYTAGGDPWEAEANPATPVFLSGPHLYTITSIGGEIRSYGTEHIRGKMGGAWAHPMRVLHGWALALETTAGTLPLEAAPRCDLFASHVTRHYSTGQLAVRWTEFVADEAAALLSIVSVENTGAAAWQGSLVVRAEADLRGCWFGGWEPAQTGVTGGAALLLAAPNGPYAGRAAALATHPASVWQAREDGGLTNIPLALNPGEACDIAVCLFVSHTDAAGAPLEAARFAAESGTLMAAKIARYAALDGEIGLETPDSALNEAWLVARRNIDSLIASYPDLPPYLLAGLPEYPQLFGCDTEYSVPGATAAGFGPIVRSTLEALAAYGRRGCARIPHEITTNGRVFNPGNTQETPQFALACWEYLRWTGDLEFVRQVYPLCVEGLEHFGWTLSGRGFPHGDGVVERLGMGECKLDSVCYLHQALVALRELAAALGHDADANEFDAHATRLAARFEHDWWLVDEGMYADSLHLDGRPRFDGHWTVAIPIQTGLARTDRARRSLARIETEWVNEWGLVHTRGVEPRVWTLPTGLLALAAFRYERPELGVHLLRNIGVTARHGTLGALKELIPVGLCFIQLWSAGLFVQGIVEGLFGLRPMAHLHTIEIAPQPPPAWPTAQLRGLPIGAHRVTITTEPGTVTIEHISGPQPLRVRYAGREAAVAPGALFRWPAA